MCDMIPSDIATHIRKYYNIEIRSYGYEKLIDYVVKKTNKQYLIDIVKKAILYYGKANIELSNNVTVQELKQIIQKNINPSNLICGFTPRDGLDSSTISALCGDLGLVVSGTKNNLISRIYLSSRYF